MRLCPKTIIRFRALQHQLVTGKCKRIFFSQVCQSASISGGVLPAFLKGRQELHVLSCGTKNMLTGSRLFWSPGFRERRCFRVRLVFCLLPSRADFLVGPHGENPPPQTLPVTMPCLPPFPSCARHSQYTMKETLAWPLSLISGTQGKLSSLCYWVGLTRWTELWAVPTKLQTFPWCYKEKGSMSWNSKLLQG